MRSNSSQSSMPRIAPTSTRPAEPSRLPRLANAGLLGLLGVVFSLTALDLPTTAAYTLSHAPTPARQATNEIEQAVRAQLSAAGLADYVTEIRASGGNVTLTGLVPDEATKSRVIEVAFGVEAVESVDSELQLSADAPAPPPPPPEDIESDSTPSSTAPAPADVVAAAEAPSDTDAIPVDDQTLAERVWKQLEEAKLDKELGEIDVENGVVTMKGKVRSKRVQDALIASILEVESVSAVESDLELVTAESGLELVQEVVRAVLNYPEHSVFDDIMVAASNDGLITLLGVVTDPFKRDDLEKRVVKILGVTEIDNQIRVLPVSPMDQELRIRLFEAIYGDELFRHLANRKNPPIHIIVEKGRVTLKGAVTNRVQKVKAASIARGVFGVFRVDNQLQTGS